MTEEVKKKEHSEEKPLEKMTVKELRVVALEFPRSTSVHDMKKDELIAFIKEAKGIKDEGPKEKIKDSEKFKLTKQEMKAKIKRLREEKDEARETKKKKRVDYLRRRINYLKKQTRKIASA
jgi:type II restriction/modification system DNA methylase subunit YeeA